MGGYIDFKISVLGDVQFERNLVQFSESISDWTEPLKKAGDIFYRVEKEQFDSQGGYSGGWVALSPRYAIYHQSTGKRRKLPRRPPVDIPETVMGIKGEWIELFRKRIVEERRRIFGAMG